MWVNRDSGTEQIDAVVARVSENAYWLFDTAASFDLRGVDAAVREFQNAVWPRVTGTFGPIWTPGIDGDPRLLILHTRLRTGVGGYFSGADSYPREIQKFSNEREIIYITTSGAAPGTRDYMATLAHELQHAVHWASDAGEDSWVNEGLSEIASELAGYRVGSVGAYLRDPATSLTEWPPNIGESAPSYGAATLFFEYLMDHYGGEGAARAIVAAPADGLESISGYLAAAGYPERALDVFRDWVVATYLDEPSGRYSYSRRDLRLGVRLVTSFVLTPTTVDGSAAPLSANYYVISMGAPEVRLEFKGSPVAELFPAAPESGESCWWGNAGDSIDTTLTRRVDLRTLSPGAPATLEYSLWHDIEDGWDYAYVEASLDAGVTWTVLQGLTTTATNPNGNSYGHGYTGSSGASELPDGTPRSRPDGAPGFWLRESVDLSPYSGRQVLVRFEYITDDAVHGRGLCLDSFAIPVLGWQDDTESPGDWDPQGFVRVNHRIPQDYLVQIVRQPAGGQVAVSQLQVRPDGTGEATVSGLAPDDKIAVIVSPITAGVAGTAKYSLKVERGG